MKWTVLFTSKARKQTSLLPENIQEVLDVLYGELEADGPIRANWPHYSKLQGKVGIYHCHLNKGKPRYVAVWKVYKNTVAVMEIKYVGTHEKADYHRFN